MEMEEKDWRKLKLKLEKKVKCLKTMERKREWRKVDAHRVVRPAGDDDARVRRVRDDAPRGKIDGRHGGLGEGQQHRGRGPGHLHLEEVGGPLLKVETHALALQRVCPTSNCPVRGPGR